MKYLRNQDVLHELLISFVIGIVCMVITYPFVGGYAFLFLFLMLVLVGIHYYFSIKRYEQIAQLSLSLDKVLHGSAIHIAHQYELHFHVVPYLMINLTVQSARNA